MSEAACPAATARTAMTKARSMGPIADVVRASGGSLARVFRRAELPMRLAYEPERTLLLKDQLRIIECASLELQDPVLAARLSTQGGVHSLGAFGCAVMSTTTLGNAIVAANRTLATFLQAGTRMQLAVDRSWARWSYQITTPVDVGRSSNELLAYGYMLDLLRRYCGPHWAPNHVLSRDATAAQRRDAQQILQCEMTRGDVAALVFPAALLQQTRPASAVAPGPEAPPIPSEDDLVTCITQVIDLGVLEGIASIDWVSRRIGVSPRSLQRHLRERGAAFRTLLNGVIRERASQLLTAGHSVTDVACALGYSDAAHFSRAFKTLAGASPKQFQKKQRHAS